MILFTDLSAVMEQGLTGQPPFDHLMKLSVTTDMFNYSFNPDLDEKLALFKKHGFDYLHWCDNWNDDVIYSKEDMRKFTEAIDDHDLVCLDVHGTATREIRIDSGLPEYVKLLENRIQYCHIVGGDAVVVHPPSTSGANLEKRVHVSKQAIEAVEKLCRDTGVALAIENCSRNDHSILGDYFELYDREFIGWCYDSGHANIHGNFEQMKHFGDRLLVTHLHDNTGEGDDHQYPGWGTIDWSDVSQWLKALDFDKPLNLEVTHNPGHYKGTMDEFLTKTYESAMLL